MAKSFKLTTSNLPCILLLTSFFNGQSINQSIGVQIVFKQPQNNWALNPGSKSAKVYPVLQMRWNNARQWRENTHPCNCKYYCNLSSRRTCPCPHRRGRGPVLCTLRRKPRLPAILSRRRSLACTCTCLLQARRWGVCPCCKCLRRPLLLRRSGFQPQHCTHHRSPCSPQPGPGNRGRRDLGR